MNVVRGPRSPTFEDRVAHAYHDYGRVCSAHPVACLSLSIFTLLVLSYPAIVRFLPPASSPMDVHWSERPAVDAKERAPEWLYLQPAAYAQQIVVRATVDPWNSFNLTVEHAVRGPLSRSFTVLKHMREVMSRTEDGSGQFIRLEDLCLKTTSSEPDAHWLPKRSCLLFSPAAIWNDDPDKFRRDENVLSSLFSVECRPWLCTRDALLGMPLGLTGIRKQFSTNRQRTIDFSLTLFQRRFDPEWREALKTSLTKDFTVLRSSAADDTTFVHVFYRPRKVLADYFPLITSYLAFMLYLYYSSCKLEMVASRWGLSFAAACSVAATLLISAGVAALLDYSPSIWGAELAPYLALIVSLENVLCITKSVVYTSPSLDVSERLSQGLANEGYALTKYFLIEISCATFGYFSGISEVVDFCRFALIGLVVDFYMQLFFYVPCLTFDLQRLGREEKERFSRMLLVADLPQHKSYPRVACPMRKIWPSLFEGPSRRPRTHSDSKIDGKPDVQASQKGHRRTVSAVKVGEMNPTAEIAAVEKPRRPVPKVSLRLRIFLTLTRARLAHRTILFLFAFFVLWIGVVVNLWRLASDSRAPSLNRTDGRERFGVSHRLLETAPLQWGEWQRRTFRWWPALFQQYNLSLAGHYITYLPPIVLSVTIPPNDQSLLFVGGVEEAAVKTAIEDAPEELRSRVNWLETQLRLYVAFSACCLLASVVLFILYACFWGRWRSGFKSTELTQKAQITAPRSPVLKTYDYYEEHEHSTYKVQVPLVFTGHRQSVECISVSPPRWVASSDLSARVLIWDLGTGERRMVVDRRRPTLAPTAAAQQRGAAENGEVQNEVQRVVAPPTPSPQIWAMLLKQGFLVLACSDGSVELARIEDGRLMFIYTHSRVGVVHLEFRGNRLVLVRLDGTIEFITVTFNNEHPLQVVSCVCVASVRAHQQPVTQLVSAPLTFITASQDHTLKVFDARTCRLLFTLHGHDSPVVSAVADHSTNIVYSCCAAGLVRAWALESGELLRTMEACTDESVELTVSDRHVLGYSACSGVLSVWEKADGSLVTRLSAGEKNTFSLGRGSLVSLSTDLAATVVGDSVLFWDITHRAMIRQVYIGGSVEKLMAVDERSLICTSGREMYRINLPLIRIR